MRRRTLCVFPSFLVLVVAAACGGGGETPSEPAATAPAAPADEATAGNVTGMVMLQGTPPPPGEIRMNSDPVCVKQSTDTKTERFVVGDGGHLANVFVYVKQGLEGRTFRTPSEPVILDQKGCRYSPHVFGIQVGQTLQVVNSDPTLHNIHAMPSVNAEFNTGQPVQGMKFDRSFTEPEVMLPFKCDVHSWMNAYVGVLTHPYYAVTGTDGMFDLSTLPPGDYVIEAWHEKLGAQTQNVTIGEKETKKISFTFTMG